MTEKQEELKPHYYQVTSLPGVNFVIKDDYEKAVKQIDDLTRLIGTERDKFQMLEGKLMVKLRVAKEIVEEQSKDEGIWFVAQTASEAHLQNELRRLHEAIEGKSQEQCAKEALEKLGE